MTTPNEDLMARAKRLRNELDDSNARLDRLCVTAMYEMEQALQSQAERIATLEGDVEYLQEDIDAMCNAIPGYRWSGGAAELIAKCFAERDALHAQLAAIAATEPVATINDLSNARMFTMEANGYSRKDKLFTRPMPAQDVTELVEAFEHHIEQTRPIERSTIALSKYKGAK